ncbi:hypothetical protein IRJ41_005657 [Triplophysa rosa]|uniref:PB1 domain-containing protein n=1 Tax=Triplophysa rosa TaxID=992332 RepID=A0A9W7WJF3_TRIRA|nr:hypothetical protein IRJ41_005657 [Triplophysa rosa]
MEAAFTVSHGHRSLLTEYMLLLDVKDANQQCCQSEVQSKKFIFSSQPFTFQTFLECVAKKFDLPTINVKVFDDSKTEVDEEAFEYLLTQPNLGVLKMIIPGTASLDGWDSDMSSILMLVHLLPPSSQGRKRPGKISDRQACEIYQDQYQYPRALG